MKKITLTLLLLLAITLSMQAQKNFLDINYIEVTGTANKEVTPDMIYLNIVINENDIKTAINEQEKNMVEKLKGIGIDVVKDLSMEDMDSYFKSRFLKKKDVLLSRNYQLLVHDGKTVAKVFTELEKIDISNISVAKIDHSKITELRKEVRANAIKAAKEKAEYLTKAVGQTIGKAIYIEVTNENEPRPIRVNNMMYKTASLAEDAYEPDIDFKTIKIESSILVRFELK
ncbi:MAG: SIMPL domain-containing protein [Paludibacteraceae bacterium]|nr:SIMPL domain-containing protein [Paludibacteraceae bacterium]